MATWTSVATLDSPTSGVFDFTSLSLSTYKVIEIRLTGITVTTDGTDVRLTFYVSSSEVTSGYRWATGSISSSGSSQSDSATGAASIVLMSDAANWDVGNAAAESMGATITVVTPGGTSFYKRAFFDAWQIGPTGNTIGTHGAGVMENAGAIDGVKIGGTSNLTAGKVRILGLA